MSILEDHDAWRENPWFKEHGETWNDYTGFYVGISLCSIIILGIIILNLVFCCCSPYKEYWRDPDTGNRLILPIWIRGPKKQQPLTLQPELTNIRLA